MGSAALLFASVMSAFSHGGQPPARTIAWTHADILNLREQPDAAARIVAKLHINTLVEEEERKGDWAKVRIRHRPAQFGIRGWLKRSFLSAQKLDWQDALKRSVNATNLQEKTQWANRAIAIDGSRNESWEQLGKVLTAAKDEVGLTRIKRHRKGLHDVYFAECLEGRAALIGRLRPGDGFQSLGSSASRQQQTRAIDALKGVAWYSLQSEHNIVPVEGSPFVAPFLTPHWNEEAASPYAPGVCREICEDARIVILGPCGGAARFLMTSPFNVVVPEQTSIGQAAHVLGRLAKTRSTIPLSGLGLTALPGTTWMQVAIHAEYPGDGERRYVESWALVDGDKTIQTLGPLWANPHSKPQNLPNASVTVTAWFQGTFDGMNTFIVVHQAQWKTSSGWAISVLPVAKAGKTHRVILHGAGC